LTSRVQIEPRVVQPPHTVSRLSLQAPDFLVSEWSRQPKYSDAAIRRAAHEAGKPRTTRQRYAALRDHGTRAIEPHDNTNVVGPSTRRVRDLAEQGSADPRKYNVASTEGTFEVAWPQYRKLRPTHSGGNCRAGWGFHRRAYLEVHGAAQGHRPGRLPLLEPSESPEITLLVSSGDTGHPELALTIAAQPHFR
jgi:hypothetical protein